MSVLDGINLCVLQLSLLILDLSFWFSDDTSLGTSLHGRPESSDFEEAFCKSHQSDESSNITDMRNTAPTRSAVQYNVEVLDFGPTPFTGEPRPQLDQAWSNILRRKCRQKSSIRSRA